MEFGFYEVDAWGEQLPGASAPQRCTLSGVAKRNSDGAPYAVPNEFICGRLALLIGLPIPPGVVVTTDNGKLAYIALQFGPRGERPPPVNVQQLVEDNPHTAAGVIAFDCWVGNPDRHQENIAYVRGEPKIPLTIFDHSHALLGNQVGIGIQQLNNTKDDPWVLGFLPQHVTSSKEFRDWASRISAIPEKLIRDICAMVVHEDGLTVDECAAVVDFLAHRKDRVLEKIGGAKGAMPNVGQWELEAS